jgi:excinuclease ABC subunit A
MTHNAIVLSGCSEHNLKDIDVSIALHTLTAITGVSGSGKSSLAFDTIYAEGQRRYVDTFSPYARQFLDRMEKPNVRAVDGIPPSIAINQTNPVRTSRSTVGTMTELHDHLKLLFARAATLYCVSCGNAVHRDTPGRIYAQLMHDPRFIAPDTSAYCMITFQAPVPDGMHADEARAYYRTQGFTRVHRSDDNVIELIQDRSACTPDKKGRLIESLETALQLGKGHIRVYPLDSSRNPGAPAAFSAHLHCPSCDIEYSTPTPNTFSFNSPLGACDTCRGFGEIMTIDEHLVVPDQSKTLRQGAIQPWQSPNYRECQHDLLFFAEEKGVPVDTPWHEMDPAHRTWVMQGEGDWIDGKWYGVRRFFDWLATKKYKMHIRMLLSKYRAYDTCPACHGTRLKPEVLQWKIGGRSIADIAVMSLERCRAFFAGLTLEHETHRSVAHLLHEITTRLDYLVYVGVGYLALDRKSRTLSGGEVQRINLTTALGTSLVNTLFVLDEPSIGMHPRDIQRIIDILHRLRDAGNTILVVEHDPWIIQNCDRVLELGPGPGAHGGTPIFTGTPGQLRHNPHTPTGRYLCKADNRTAGRRRVRKKATSFLAIHNATAHNLANITVTIPLHRFVCITGVSGSGKSTLLEDVCYRGVARLLHKQVAQPGEHERIDGAHLLDTIEMVDQSPPGRTSRANPASYSGVFDTIRRVFAARPQAQRRGYTASHFSFNSDKGRCPVCKGSGYEHIEMQFLSDVYLPCEACDTSRFRREIRDIRVPCDPQGKKDDPSLPDDASISEVLGLTVTQAITFFKNRRKVGHLLQPLVDVGLGYLTLGQPLPSLSGGEAQRLKLASHIAHAGRDHPGHTLFCFDEPTTGLHPQDIATLLQACHTLVDRGHSVVMIEHNLDVIADADWIIDLGPEGGDRGGRCVAAGTPAQVRRRKKSHTAAALSAHLDTASTATSHACRSARSPSPSSSGDSLPSCIYIHHAREHNLRTIDISIPHNAVTVLTGISGSGKSTVAFDILFSEGQRRYLESLNAYSRQFVQPSTRPDVDAVTGIPPSVAISQRSHRGGTKSTVATVTEIYNYLRLLFVTCGTQYCPECRTPVVQRTFAMCRDSILRTCADTRIHMYAPLVMARKGYYTDLASWAARHGYDTLLVDGKPVNTHHWPRLDRYREHTIECPVDSITVSADAEERITEALDRGLQLGNGFVRIYTTDPQEKKTDGTLYSSSRACPHCGRSFNELDPRLFSFNSRHGWCPSCQGTGRVIERMPDTDGRRMNDFRDMEPRVSEEICPECNGTRLRAQARAVRFHGRTLPAYMDMSVEDARAALADLPLSAREARIAHDILQELDARLSFLNEVGLPYLSLGRSARTLSGGEAQRIRLAAQLGSNLTGVCYILDEPTIGLHPRDNERLLRTVRALTDKGNTTVIVEHDEDTIRSADHIIDLGPGGGEQGGRIMAQGRYEDIIASHASLTGRYLRTPLQHPLTPKESLPADISTLPHLHIRGARLHNLARIAPRIPLQHLSCVTGVSGSGKSTLVREVLYGNARRMVGRTKKTRACGCHG